MRIKRFVAPNMRQAMNVVKEELGDDAVILTSRYTDEGVEVTAAIDPESTASKPAASKSRLESPYQMPPQPASLTGQSTWQSSSMRPDVLTQAGGDIGSLFHELKSMREMLEQQLAGFAWQNAQIQSPVKIALLKRLATVGLGWDLAQALVSCVADDANDEEAEWRKIQADILGKIPQLQDALLDEGGILAFVGPTGVGKTTTIAKIAARFVLRYGQAGCAIVTLDTYKIGAQEQLKIFTDLIGVSLFTAQTPEEFKRLVMALSDRKLVLVDTAGLSQRDARLHDYLMSSLSDVSASIKTRLVISAATQLGVLKEIVAAFGQMKLDACILSKLDEAMLLGPALTVLAENRLPLAYCSNGQRVPEDLLPMTARDLLDQAIVMGKHSDSSALAGAAYGFSREITDV
jgi:flagellar biosynthesis protein FlhF